MQLGKFPTNQILAWSVVILALCNKSRQVRNFEAKRHSSLLQFITSTIQTYISQGKGGTIGGAYSVQLLSTIGTCLKAAKNAVRQLHAKRGVFDWVCGCLYPCSSSTSQLSVTLRTQLPKIELFFLFTKESGARPLAGYMLGPEMRVRTSHVCAQ